MADTETLFVPTELTGEHYRPIGGSFDSLEKAMQAMEQHFRNIHGGAGLFQVFKREDAARDDLDRGGGLDQQRPHGDPGDLQDPRAAAEPVSPSISRLISRSAG